MPLAETAEDGERIHSTSKSQSSHKKEEKFQRMQEEVDKVVVWNSSLINPQRRKMQDLLNNNQYDRVQDLIETGYQNRRQTYAGLSLALNTPEVLRYHVQ